jgi:hypothetical protein
MRFIIQFFCWLNGHKIKYGEWTHCRFGNPFNIHDTCNATGSCRILKCSSCKKEKQEFFCADINWETYYNKQQRWVSRT